MNHTDNPVGTLSAALAHAQYEAFSDVEYVDRDWEKYLKWRETYFDKLPRDEQARLYEQERATGKHMAPADCLISKTRRPDLREIQVIAMFPQIWGSTALGFGGVGGASMTTAYTIVLECNSEIAVYFGGRHAYTVQKPNNQFWDDVDAGKMKPVPEAAVYLSAQNV
jgi:hypothetical protein